LDSSAGEVRTITFKTDKGQSGRIISVRTGVVLTYTNLATGESVSIKTSGSVTSAVLGPDGVTETRTATGHNGLILFPEDVPAGPTTTQYNGRIVYTFNTQTGFVEVIRTSGQATDIARVTPSAARVREARHRWRLIRRGQSPLLLEAP
jgi:hypothetical protein